ncbi:MAG: Nramp family divalent metal transporter [Planctomycetota bacterium]|nr:Nramp family divalent metal transporter [Planctomycetota bacterium]
MSQPSDPYAQTDESFVAPPRGWRQTLRHLGPGMILVGSVVGSGELLMTTKLGAVAGFTLLWFILLSCFIKVVVQAEVARHTISSGQTFLQVFNTLPGPSSPRPLWLTLPWLSTVAVASVVAVALYMQLPTESQTLVAGLLLGGGALTTVCIAALALRTASQRRLQAGRFPRPQINWFLWLWLASMLLTFVNSGAILGAAGQAVQMAFPLFGEHGARFWAMLVAVVAAVLLLSGSYRSLEKTLVVMVATFTLLTLICTVLLQWTDYAISWHQLQTGLTVSAPPATTLVVLTALAAYAGTGVAYGEMWSYTYWCVEKGYARNVGKVQPGTEWPQRARGWIRVMYTDVLLTMVVYTVSTICFYLLGAAILHANGTVPDGLKTLVILRDMYTESLADWAATLFVVGGFFVLFSTVLAGTAGFSRLLTDALGIVGVVNAEHYPTRLRFIRIFTVVMLVMFSIAYWLFENPPQMLAITSSLIAAVMYPILGLGALYLRYRRVDPRIAPASWTTGWLWICGLGLAIISPGGILLTLAIKFEWISIGA